MEPDRAIVGSRDSICGDGDYGTHLVSARLRSGGHDCGVYHNLAGAGGWRHVAGIDQEAEAYRD